MGDITLKYRNGKIWLIGVATLLGMGKAKAQDVMQNTTFKESITNTTNVVPSGITNPATIEVKNPAQLNKKNTTRNSDTSLFNQLYDDTSLLLDIERFTKHIKSPGENLNQDSIYKLSDTEFAKFSQNRMKQPPRIEIKNTPVKSLDDAGTVHGAFIDNINLIELNYFSLDETASENMDEKRRQLFIRLIDATNQELPFIALHESKHYCDRLSKSLSGLSPMEMLEYEHHVELVANSVRMVAGRQVFRETNDIYKAFPLSIARACVKYSNAHNIALGNPKDLFDEKPQEILKLIERYGAYINYLYKNRETLTSEMTAAETDALVNASIQIIKNDSIFYKKQISQQRIETDIVLSRYTNYFGLRPLGYRALIKSMWLDLLETADSSTINKIDEFIKNFIKKHKMDKKAKAAAEKYPNLVEQSLQVRNVIGNYEKSTAVTKNTGLEIKNSKER